MPFDSFMTDPISIYDSAKKTKRWDYKCSFQNKIHINKIIDDIEKWDIIERKISERKVEDYLISDIEYVTVSGFESTKISYKKNKIIEKMWIDDSKIVIQNSIIQSSNFWWSNNRIEINIDINNEIESILEVVTKLNMNQKEEIIQLLKEAKKESNEENKRHKFTEILSILWNIGTLGQLLIAIKAMLQLTS